MNLGELCQEVFTLTNRGDLLAETQLAIRRATLKFHMIDFWKRDKFEKILTFNATSTLQIDLSTQFERFRKFGALHPYDPTSGLIVPCYDQITGNARGLKEIDPVALFDAYSADKKDVFYMAGNSINIRFAQGRNGLYANWYKFPTVQNNNYSSWIAEMYPYIIIEDAAAVILTAIGQVEDAVRFNDPVHGSIYVERTGHLAVLRTNELEATAR